MMKKRNDKSEKLNNKGITLIELIVAMAILAIVVVPFVHSFVTAAKTNQKAKERFYATTAAEDIMELWETVNLEKEVAYIRSLVPDGSPDPVTANSGKYTIDLSSDILAGYIGEDFVNNGYSAQIILDPSVYSATNTKEFSEVISYNSQTDGIYMMSEGFDDNEIKEFAKAESLNESYLKPIVNRDISVTVSPNGSRDGVDFVKVSVKVVYSTGDGKTHSKPSVVVYNNIVKEGKEAFPLKNIYLLYTPLPGATCREHIYVYNDSDSEFNLFLLRENTVPGYSIPVALSDNNDGSGNSKITIRTNLFNENKFYNPGPGESFDVTSDLKMSVTYKPSKDSAMPYDDDLINIKTLEGLTLKGDAQSECRIYQMNVIVSKNGQELTNITGSKINR